MSKNIEGFNPKSLKDDVPLLKDPKTELIKTIKESNFTY
jgi:hypothetical protein